MSSSKRIHVFASDVLPFPGCASSAGGERSKELISALRDAGHQVTYSMPLITHLAGTQREKIIPRLTPDELWYCEHLFEPEIVLGRVQPDIAIFCNINTFASVRNYARDIVQIVDFHGPLHLEGLLFDADDVGESRESAAELGSRAMELVSKLRDVDYIITTCERQKYLWAAYCSLAGYSFNELSALVCPISIDVPVLPRKPSKNMSMVFSGGFYPWQNPDRFLRAAAQYLDGVDGAVLHIFGGPHAGLPNERHVYALIENLRQHKCVRYHGYRPTEEVMAALSEAWCALELMDRNIERELAITGRTVGFLSAGTPVAYNNYSTLSELIARYDAGWAVDTTNTETIGKIIEELAAGGLPLVERLSKNALTLSSAEFDRAKNMAPLVELCNGSVRKRRSNVQRVRSKRSTSSLGKVLSVSPSTAGVALLELRNVNPLRSLHRQGLIDSFTTCTPGLENLAEDHSYYDAVLIQRTVPIWCYQAFANLGLPFMLDVDDNLLAGAAYRGGATEPELQVGLRLCAGLSTPNPRLVRLLEKYSGLRLADKAYMTPNALPYSEGVPKVSKPSAILWIQSDIAALTSSKDAVIDAVEKFSLTHKLPVVLIGRNVLHRPQFTHQKVMGEIDFVSNLQMLEYGATSIGVCPLETVTDLVTLDFIAGKSDLKMLLFDGYGHPGIYSAAPPYTESSLLPVGRVIDNSHQSWSEALEYQYEEGWRLTADQAARIREERHIDRVARESWMGALEGCALARPVRGVDLYRAMLGFRRMGCSPVHSMSYFVGYEDLQKNCLHHNPNWSAMEHYDQHGRRENRSVLHSVEAHSELLSNLTRDSESCANDLVELESLRRRVAEAEAREEGLRRSYSWRVTAPLRAMARPFLGPRSDDRKK